MVSYLERGKKAQANVIIEPVIKDEDNIDFDLSMIIHMSQEHGKLV